MDKKARKKTRSTLSKSNHLAAFTQRSRRIRKKRPGARPASMWTDSKFPLVRVTAARLGMRLNDTDWTVIWRDTYVTTEQCLAMLPHQRINRFPGISTFSCKDLLAQNLNRLYNVFPNRYKIFPKTWCLPQDYAGVTAYSISQPKTTFIIKPSRGTEGRGIYLTKNLKLIKSHERKICQVYIHRPFLIDGLKFDLRVYALISSVNPLRLYVYKEGLCRFATKKYEVPSSRNMNNKYMHLTNYSVNRKSAYYVHDHKAGTKRSFRTLNKWFVNNGFNVKSIWSAIDDAIIKCTLVALPTLRRYYVECFPHHVLNEACFQILGFDMILDRRLKPYVLEVNHSPSMHAPTSLDSEVKSALLHDTFVLLNLKSDERDNIAAQLNKLGKLRAHGDRPHQMYNNNEPNPTDPKIKGQYLKSQEKWEQNHLGDYRKVYPNKHAKRYKPIMEYLERLKWPTLHKLPGQLSKEVNFQKAGKRNLSNKPKETLEIFKGLTTEGGNREEFVNDTASNTCAMKQSNQPEEEHLEEYWGKLNSALRTDVMRQYNFIDRITFTKIAGSRKKVAERYQIGTVDAEGSRAAVLHRGFTCAKSNE